jgi:hypothetical protein
MLYSGALTAPMLTFKWCLSKYLGDPPPTLGVTSGKPCLDVRKRKDKPWQEPKRIRASLLKNGDA